MVSNTIILPIIRGEKVSRVYLHSRKLSRLQAFTNFHGTDVHRAVVVEKIAKNFCSSEVILENVKLFHRE